MGLHHGSHYPIPDLSDDHCLQPHFPHLFQFSLVSDKGVGSRLRKEGAGSVQIEGAMTVVSDPTGTGLAHCPQYLIVVSLRYEDHQFLKLPGPGGDHHPGLFQAQLFTQDIIHPVPGGIQIGMCDKDMNVMFEEFGIETTCWRVRSANP